MSNKIKLKTKIRRYDAVMKTTLLYGSETWPMIAANTKKLEASQMAEKDFESKMDG